MGGGLMQLVAYGAQDIYLTGRPQITFFKSVYRRHTNFAVESIQQDVLSTPGFGNRVSVTIARNGDLLKRIWLEYSPFDMLSSLDPNGETIAANFGHSLIDYIDIEIGGQLIDRHYGTWLTIWNYLTESNPTGSQGAIDNYSTAPGETNNIFYGVNPVYVPGDNAVIEVAPRATRYNRMAYTHRAQVGVTSGLGAPQYAWIPLQFWFCKNPGLAIPLIALQYHEIILYINFNPIQYCRTGVKLSGFEFSRFAVYADFVYLDTTERRQFSQNVHEYLIEQLQRMTSVTDINIKLAFNHPVKEIIWVRTPLPVSGDTRYTVVPGGASPSAGFTTSTTILNKYTIVLNGTQRFSAKDITYFTRTQVWEAHTGFGSVLFPDSVAVYSFALRPEEHQPSGSCNFSRIDTAVLQRVTTYLPNTTIPAVDTIDIYAVNLNVYRIMSGMGGVAYSN